jgi:M6 family metalloprotease-like protein
VHPNADLPLSAWEEFFFSTNSYRGTNITGQPVHGSVNDYYHEVSCDRFTITGKVFNWVTLEKKRADYSQGTANSRTREAFFREALDKLTEREGAGGSVAVDRRDLAGQPDQAPDLVRILGSYHGRKVSLADACLVRMAELWRDSTVVTIDANDFAVYRRFGRGTIQFIAPPKS